MSNFAKFFCDSRLRLGIKACFSALDLHCYCTIFYFIRCFKQDERNYKDPSIG